MTTTAPSTVPSSVAPPSRPPVPPPPLPSHQQQNQHHQLQQPLRPSPPPLPPRTLTSSSTSPSPRTGEPNRKNSGNTGSLKSSLDRQRVMYPANQPQLDRRTPAAGQEPINRSEVSPSPRTAHGSENGGSLSERKTNHPPPPAASSRLSTHSIQSSSPSNRLDQHLNCHDHHEENQHASQPLLMHPTTLSSANISTLSAAEEIIRELDQRYAEMSALALEAAQEMEEARRNARAASELAKQFSSPSNHQVHDQAQPKTHRPTKEVNIVFASTSSSPSSEAASATTSLTHQVPTVRAATKIPIPPAHSTPHWTQPSSSRAGDENYIIAGPAFTPHEGSSTSPSLPKTTTTPSTSSSIGYWPSASVTTGYATYPVQPPPPFPSSRKRGGTSTPTSAERLAQAHAEDVLSLSLELERAKQALENETKAHQETQTTMKQWQAKHKQLSADVDRLLNDLETQRQDHGRAMDQCERELRLSQSRAQAAEEDAQLALELARGNAQSREQLEGWLQRALQEIQVLREYVMTMDAARQQSQQPPSIQQNPTVAVTDSILRKRTVRFADSPTVYTPPTSIPPPPPPPLPAAGPWANDNEYATQKTPVRAPRELVAAGRQAFQRLAASSTSGSSSSAHGQGQTPSMDEKSLSLVDTSPEALTERRKRVKKKLEALANTNTDITTASTGIPMPLSASSVPASRTPNVSNQLGSAVEALDVCRSTAVILKDSGKRLHLSGRWWTGSTNPTDDEIHLETLARHYCTSVEVQVERMKKEIIELESLCALWEKDWAPCA